MYNPQFTITNKLVRTLASIEVSKNIIETKEIPKEKESEIQSDSLLKLVYFGTHIDGNELTQVQTKQILEGATIVVQNLDVQEVINYKRTLNLIDSLASLSSDYLLDHLRDIHSTLNYNILSPDRSGMIRKTQIVIRDEETNEIIMTPPQASQVEPMLIGFFAWLNSIEARDIHPVIRAAIVHFFMLTVHPFVEGTGSTTRMFINLLLRKEGYSPRNMLFFEEIIENNFDDYFTLFFNNQSSETNMDLTKCIEYFAEVVNQNLLQTRVKFLEINEIVPSKFKVGESVALSTRQMKILQYIEENGRAVMKELKEVITNVSDDTILRDLTALYKKGIIEKEGTTKASSYILKK